MKYDYTGGNKPNYIVKCKTSKGIDEYYCYSLEFADKVYNKLLVKHAKQKGIINIEIIKNAR